MNSQSSKREIKFKVIASDGTVIGFEKLDSDGWFKTYSDEKHWESGVMRNTMFLHHCTRLQFTGYHSKDHEEIYEGDRLKCGEATCTVAWIEGGFTFTDRDGWHDDWNWADDAHRFKIIS